MCTAFGINRAIPSVEVLVELRRVEIRTQRVELPLPKKFRDQIHLPCVDFDL